MTTTSYDIILSPSPSPKKATKLTEVNQVVFRVTLDATKPAIAKAIEGLFKVKVKAVNTVRVKGKKKLFRGRAFERSDFKKAVVTLEEGYQIDIYARDSDPWRSSNISRRRRANASWCSSTVRSSTRADR